jgi:hypothetical protein
MSLRFRTPSFAALAAALALAPAASAIDVAGSYEGKLSCTGLDAGGNRAKQTDTTSELQIAQTGHDLLVSIDELSYAGVLVDASGAEERQGAAVVTACNGDGDPNGRLESALLEAKGAPGSDKLSLKLRSVSGSGGSLECSGSYHRIDVGPVPLDPCPVFHACVCVGVNEGEFPCGNGGVSGDRGEVETDLTQSERDSGFDIGVDTGWVCVAQ